MAHGGWRGFCFVFLNLYFDWFWILIVFFKVAERISVVNLDKECLPVSLIQEMVLVLVSLKSEPVF